MKEKSNHNLMSEIDKVLEASTDDYSSITSLLDFTLEKLLEHMKRKIPATDPEKTRKILIGNNELIHSNRFGVTRTPSTIILSRYVFDLPKLEKESLLFFFLVKESLIHFVSPPLEYEDINESVMNIVALLWLKEYFSIQSFDNRIFGAVRSRIYSRNVAGKTFDYWDYLLYNALRKISFGKFWQFYQTLLSKSEEEGLSEEEVVSNLAAWIKKTVSDPDETINPIYLSKRLYNVLILLMELGYQKASSTKIAKVLKVHQNTIRTALSELRSDFSTQWNPIKKYELLNLNDYFLLVKIPKKGDLEKIADIILQNPYIQHLFKGRTKAGNLLLYSVSFYCPHLASETLQATLKKLKGSKKIIEFSLQQIRERKSFGAVTLNLLEPTLENFIDLIESGGESIEKFVFYEKSLDTSLEFDPKAAKIDYNLLYFLSVLRAKYLIKARYGVNVTEFYKLCELNHIPNTDVTAQMNLINQLEIRARRRGLLDYYLYIRSYSATEDIFVLEITLNLNKTDETLDLLIDKMRVFAGCGQITLYDRVLFVLPGINHEHPVAAYLEKLVSTTGFSTNCYTITFHKSQFVPYHELFDYEKNSWQLVRK